MFNPEDQTAAIGPRFRPGPWRIVDGSPVQVSAPTRLHDLLTKAENGAAYAVGAAVGLTMLYCVGWTADAVLQALF